MPVDIRRLIAPRSIALIGAGAWTDAVAAANVALGYRGTLWRVHPSRPSTATTTYYRTVAELPAAPDAAFIAVPNHEVPAVAGALAAQGCGGFVCFSAGFAETGSDVGRRLSRELMSSAGSLPFFGPNCYGFVNFFERAAMMPDQVVGEPLNRGVALICQSGTIALTLMFNHRSLPIGALYTVGNQSRLAVEDLLEVLCEDPRITAFGLYLEGIKDAAGFTRAAARARAAGKPIAVVKSGRTAAAARTAQSHTGAMAGADAVFDALCRQAGLARCETLGSLCETLKVLHAGGGLPGRKVLIMGASGGDMAMTSDVARGLDLDFAAIPEPQAGTLRGLLSDRVTLANPFDIHTYTWFDPPTLGRVFRTALEAGYDAVGFMLDCPPEDRADTAAYRVVIDEFISAAQAAAAAAAPPAAAPGVAAAAEVQMARRTLSRAALIASLPESLSAGIRRLCIAGGVVPLQGQREALEALALAAGVGAGWRALPGVELQMPPQRSAAAYGLGEAEGKRALAAYGVRIPAGRTAPAAEAPEVAAALGFPVVLKATGAHLAHKSDVGGVVLNVQSSEAARAAALRLAALSDTLLIEEMCTDGVAEILVGVIVDPQFGQVLVVGAGGVLTELLRDTATLLPPWTPESIGGALRGLSVARLLDGYRGKPPGDIPALVDCILGVARYATANLATLVELDVNPVIVRAAGRGVMAVDALIRLCQP